MTVKAPAVLKQQIIHAVDVLPAEALEEVKTFLDYLHFKQTQLIGEGTPYTPVKLEGLWKGVQITDEDITEIRQEMWDDFGDREP